MTIATGRPGLGANLLRLFWLAVLTAHATIAVAWWWLMPGGFPLSHPRFWLNSVLPWIVLATVLWARLARGVRGEIVRQAVLSAIVSMWIASAISARLVFPTTFQLIWLAPLLAGLLMAGAWLAQFGGTIRRTAVTVAILIGTAMGAMLPIAQRPDAPDTRPLKIAAPGLPPDAVPVSDFRTIALASGVQVHPGEGLIMCSSGRMLIGVQPLLTFISRSPDGAPVLLARRRERIGPPRQLVGLRRSDATVDLSYRDDGASFLRIDATDASGLVRVESTTRLERTVWSHLNTFTELTVTGHRKLSLAFSPCPDARIEVHPMGYPFGRPARFAYLDAADVLRVVEARSAEKGPFTTLAWGHLRRTDPLSLTVFDEAVPVFRITLDDWAVQAGEQLSPTAGWRVPVNAIEFALQSDTPASAGGIFVTLAATSVGRGFDSVGHRSGAYRNRMTIERLSK